MTVELPGGNSQLITFIIEESDSNWQIVSELIATQGAVNLVETTFSDEEIRNADWLRFFSTFEQGYPQPKPHWPLKQLSYEILCPKCTIYQQTHPMRLAKEPNLGKKSFMSTIWTKEIFCTPEVVLGLESIQAKGYEVWETLIHKTGVPSQRVSQLFIPGIASQGVNIDKSLERTTCSLCGVTKYFPHVRGPMYLTRKALLPDTDFMLTHEWFGHGSLAWREILVSNRIAKFILDQGWKGVRFKVVELV